MNEIQNLMKQEESQNSLFNDACVIIEQAKTIAYKSVDEILIKRNWLLGMRIQHEVLKDKRAEYGEQVIKKLAKDLSVNYGKGFSMRNLYYFIDFYQTHLDFFELKDAETQIFMNKDILQSLTAKSAIRLSWTHYNIILQESDAGARIWYENEAANEMWSTRTLQRNISSQYYHRLLKSQNQDVDMYVKMYDELVRPNGHNPTIGILLCADTDEDVAHYSVLNGNDQLYATRYLTFMPTKEELRREIERQKEIFMLQHQVSK